jgi:hypothetical protein
LKKFVFAMLAAGLLLAVPSPAQAQTIPACEIAPQTPVVPTAPKNLRKIPGIGYLLSLIAPTAHAETQDPHAYYKELASRGDCLYAASLRSQKQVSSIRSRCDYGCFFHYDFANDPDPRKQDAMKFTLPQGHASGDEQIRIPLPQNGFNNQSAFIAMDYWTGKEWTVATTKITNHKGSPLYFFRGSTSATIGFWTGYQEAGQSPQTQPPGGPFVEMLWTHSTGAAPDNDRGTWRDGDPGFPRMRLPHTVASTLQRSYTEGLMPVDKTDQTAVGGTALNVGQEIGIIPEKWHRFYYYFERHPEEDYVCTRTACLGIKMQAYRISVWFADDTRGPIRVVDDQHIGFRDDGFFINQIRIENSCGNQCVGSGSLEVIRGPLVKYYRNLAVLRGISKADVLPLLRKVE